MTDYCQSCLDRTGQQVPAVRCVGGEWMCAQCFVGVDARTPKDSLTGLDSVVILGELDGIKKAFNQLQREVAIIRREFMTTELPEIPGGLATEIIRAVEEEFQAPLALLAGPCRQSWLCSARSMMSMLLRDECKYSYPKIGILMGRRDHATVIHQIRRARMNRSKEFLASTSRIRVRINKFLEQYTQAKTLEVA